MNEKMTVTLDEFMGDFTPEERAQVEARSAKLVEEELTLRSVRQASPKPSRRGRASKEAR